MYKKIYIKKIDKNFMHEPKVNWNGNLVSPQTKTTSFSPILFDFLKFELSFINFSKEISSNFPAVFLSANAEAF